jgi:hypothetical protein
METTLMILVFFTMLLLAIVVQLLKLDDAQPPQKITSHNKLLRIWRLP